MSPWLSSTPVAAQPMPTSPHVTPCAAPQGLTLRMKSREFWHQHETTELASLLRARGGCPSIPSHLLPSEYVLAIQGGKLAGIGMRGQDHTQHWSHFKILCFDWEAIAQNFVSIPVLENHPLMSALPFIYFLNISFQSSFFLKF